MSTLYLFAPRIYTALHYINRHLMVSMTMHILSHTNTSTVWANKIYPYHQSEGNVFPHVISQLLTHKGSAVTTLSQQLGLASTEVAVVSIRDGRCHSNGRWYLNF